MPDRLARLGRRAPPIVGELGLRTLRGLAFPAALLRYARDLRAYGRLPGAEPLRLRDAHPKLADRLLTSPYDAHYFHQDVWAARWVAETAPARHVDVGSRVDFVGFLTSLTEVTFVDIRPLEASVDGLTSVEGSLVALPFADHALESISCLHVAEHVGLGRYRDLLDPHGTRRAASELQRVLAPGGQLLFSLPVGVPRLCFNAHRVHAPSQIRGYFDELELVEHAGVDDDGQFARWRELRELEGARYACGMFRMVRSGG